MNYIRVIQQDNTCSQDHICILNCYRDKLQFNSHFYHTVEIKFRRSLFGSP